KSKVKLKPKSRTKTKTKAGVKNSKTIKAKKKASVKGATKKPSDGVRKSKPLPVKPPSLEGKGIRELAAAISSYIKALGFDPVLTGQGCAAVYGASGIHLRGLEFVISEYISKKIEAAMKELGFKHLVHRTYGSEKLGIEVSFLPPPVCVGDEMVGDIPVIKTSSGDLSLLSPTDCVRHRLAYYYRFGNKDGLDEALIVARKNKVDLDLIERWSHWEWASDKFQDFHDLLRGFM
ncbi:MAG TPA: hypothetical protein PKU96_02740, partial [bacterium]|nr:hypothetical protein [bacterium]